MAGKIILVALMVLCWGAAIGHYAKCVGPGVQWLDAVIGGACLVSALALTKAWIKG